MASFWRELRRRNVFKVGAAYAVLGWLVLQVANNLFPPLGLPGWTQSLVAALLLLGLPFALLLAWVYEITPEGVKKTEQVAPEQSVRHVTGRKLNYVLTGLFGLAVAFLAIEQYVDDRSAVATRTASPVAEPATTEAPQPSVAVLPFADTSADAEQEYFADGLTDELINSLNRIQGLRVTGRTSAFYFKGKNEELGTIGARLNVDHVLEGSVRKSGDELRITAQLINVRTGYQLWGETYERTLEDIFAIQDDIASSVAEALQITLGVGELGTFPGMTRNVAAYDEVLKGRARHFESTPESILSAIEHFQRALASDPSFALAWLDLADVYWTATFVLPDGAEEWSRELGKALERARALTPDSPLISLWAAYQNSERGAWREAAVIYGEQLEPLTARYGTSAEALRALRWVSAFLKRVGRTREAIGYLERVRAAEPLDGSIATDLGDAYGQLGAFSAAFEEFDRGIELSGPGAFLVASALTTALASRDRAEIERRFPAAVANERTYSWLNVAMARHLDDPAGAAVEIRSIAAAESADASLVLNLLAHWAAYYGDPETALDLLRQTAAPQRAILAQSIWRPVFGDTRRLPGFKNLVSEIGLVDYWREYGWGDFCRPVSEDDFACE